MHEIILIHIVIMITIGIIVSTVHNTAFRRSNGMQETRERNQKHFRNWKNYDDYDE